MTTALSFVAPARRTRRPPRFSIAVHEASHAITARHLGWHVKMVDCVQVREPDGCWRNGRCVFSPGDRGKGSFTPLHNLIISCAGQIGERLAGGRNLGGAGDNAHIQALTVVLAGSLASERALVRYAREEARRIIQLRWPEIEVLATALLDRERLNAEEIERVVGPVEADWNARVDAHIERHGQADPWKLREAERHNQPRKVERRHAAEAALRFIVHRLAESNNAAVDADEIDSWLSVWASRAGLDPDAVKQKFDTALDAHRAAIQWRPVRELNLSGATDSARQRSGGTTEGALPVAPRHLRSRSNAGDKGTIDRTNSRRRTA